MQFEYSTAETLLLDRTSKAKFTFTQTACNLHFECKTLSWKRGLNRMSNRVRMPGMSSYYYYSDFC